MTIREALVQGALRLDQARVPNSRLTAELLLFRGLAVDRAYLYAHDDRELSRSEAVAFDDAIAARASGVPAQYIVGRQEFFGRDFAVTPAVLIPRPETELLVESALALIPAGAPALVVDVGTGSGAIAVTIALERPTARVFATDISFDALCVARQNASALGAPVSFALMDLLGAWGGSFDFVLSNPPYVDPADAPALDREVRDHEPALALFAPEAGLGVIRRLVAAAGSRLKPGGYLILEIGMAMDSRVSPLFDNAWEPPAIKRDLQGIPRTVTARRSAVHS